MTDSYELKVLRAQQIEIYRKGYSILKERRVEEGSKS